MAALGSAFRMLTRRGIFQTSRAFSLGSTSRASVAVVSIMFINKEMFMRKISWMCEASY